MSHFPSSTRTPKDHMNPNPANTCNLSQQSTHRHNHQSSTRQSHRTPHPRQPIRPRMSSCSCPAPLHCKCTRTPRCMRPNNHHPNLGSHRHKSPCRQPWSHRTPRSTPTAHMQCPCKSSPPRPCTCRCSRRCLPCFRRRMPHSPRALRPRMSSRSSPLPVQSNSTRTPRHTPVSTRHSDPSSRHRIPLTLS